MLFRAMFASHVQRVTDDPSGHAIARAREPVLQRAAAWLRALAGHLVWALLVVGAWTGTYRLGLAAGATLLWVPLFYRAVTRRWRLGWATLIGTLAAAAAAPYLFALSDFPHGKLAAFGACLVFGIEIGLIAECYALLSPNPLALLTIGPVVAVLVEHLRACAFSWPTLLSHAPLSVFPTGRLLAMIGPLGVAWINFLHQTVLAAALAYRSRRRFYWGAWLAMTLGLLLGGTALRPATTASPPVDGVLIIQPGTPFRPLPGNPTRPLPTGDAAARLTLAALQRHRPSLIVWPETSLAPAYVEEDSRGRLRLLESTGTFGIRPFGERIAAQTGAHFIAGLLLHYPNGDMTNGAVCISPDGQIQWYEKGTLVWFVETLPPELGAAGQWLRLWQRPPGYLRPGRHRRVFACLIGTRRVNLQAAICLEKYVYWGWTAQDPPTNAAMVHVGNESYFATAPSLLFEHRWAMRSRALQTGYWQFSAQTYRGSCVVAPSGRILTQLPPGPGWIFVSRSSVSTHPVSYSDLWKLPRPELPPVSDSHGPARTK